jgi:8-amino-7-oxononanoate synthase
VQQLQRSLQTLIAESTTTTLTSLLPSDSPILCIEVPNAATVMDLGERLTAAGFLGSAVRPPTVPTSRLRLTVMATHESSHIQQLVEVLRRLAITSSPQNIPN